MSRRRLTFETNVRPGPWLVTALVAAFLLAAAPTVSSAAGVVPPSGPGRFLPPAGELFQGEAGQPISTYEQAVGKHPAVYEIFAAWGEYLPGIFQDAANARARLMVHITTASGSQEMITPAGIAAGAGDAWLIALGQAMYASGAVTYVRLMAEMDAYWNDYSAFEADGRPRDRAHSTAAYRNAWRRVTLILRGGKLAVIDQQLRRLRLPAVKATGDLPRPKVAMLWVPQVAGAPDVRGNQPANYWPGGQWVDWVGTDFYGKFPNFTGLTAFYNAFARKPFVFGEYALWGADDPRFIDRLFGWMASHRRTRMLIYNQGLNPVGPLRLWRYPSGARELRRLIAAPRFPAFAPELAQ